MSSNSLSKTEKLAPHFQGISRQCYAAMQSETALALTAPYHVEELRVLENYLAKNADTDQPFEHFIAIGCGNLRYMDVALRFCKTYTAIDPNFQEQIDPEKQDYLKRHCHIRTLSKCFEDVARDELPEGKKLFFFLFNVFPYLDGALVAQEKLVNPGDGVIISSWNNNSFEALRLQSIYYDYLNGAYSSAIARSEFNGYIDDVEKKSAVFCSGAERLKGKTTDILVLKI